MWTIIVVLSIYCKDSIMDIISIHLKVKLYLSKILPQVNNWFNNLAKLCIYIILRIGQNKKF